MRSALLANLGFVLQISGIFIFLPIVISFIFPNETSATVGLFIAASVFLGLGFLLNALCERKELSFKQSCALVVLVFIILSFIGSIPYFYLAIEDASVPLIQRFTDSVFESTSGFTTTGFSVIPDLSTLPQSMILYRGLTQFVGGIGIVLIMLAFFYPEAKLKEFSRSMGFGKNGKVKKTFLLIISIYCTYTIVMVISGYLLGYPDLVSLASFIFSSLSTGGFSPMADISTAVTQPPLNFIIPISMLLGATNFVLLAGLFKGKFKEFFKSEVSVFIVILLASIAAVVYFFKLSPYDATFHVLSSMSTTGFGYLPVHAFSDTFKLFLISLMFIGGTSLSTAGGIKMVRLLLLLKSVKKATVDTITQRDSKLTLLGKDYASPEIVQSGILVILMGTIAFGSSLIITAYGFTPVNAAFEATAALATAGLSVGVVGPMLALPLKWLFIFLMIVGRVEVLSLLVIFSRAKEPPPNSKHTKSKSQTEERSKESGIVELDVTGQYYSDQEQPAIIEK